MLDDTYRGFKTLLSALFVFELSLNVTVSKSKKQTNKKHPKTNTQTNHKKTNKITML